MYLMKRESRKRQYEPIDSTHIMVQYNLVVIQRAA